jgi:hypothetical protein
MILHQMLPSLSTSQIIESLHARLTGQRSVTQRIGDINIVGYVISRTKKTRVIGVKRVHGVDVHKVNKVVGIKNVSEISVTLGYRIAAQHE